METSLGAPEVVARRMQLFSSPWTMQPKHMFEAQTMVLEKMLAASQFWWSMAATWPMSVTAAKRRSSTRTVRDFNRALRPMHDTVRGNVARLRKP